jgi:GDSL-like Lipase/Acylhydrolase family
MLERTVLAMRTLFQIVCMASFACLALGSQSSTLRYAFSLVLSREVARVWAPNYALVGDSLAQNCKWQGHLTWNPIDVANLAESGAVIRQAVPQITEARRLGVKYILIAAGINDLLLDNAPTERIEFDFDILLRALGREQRGIVTLIPYTSDGALTPRINSANSSIRRLAERRSVGVIDLNPELSARGVRKSEMTSDGVHLTDAACSIWREMLLRRLNQTSPAHA